MKRQSISGQIYHWLQAEIKLWQAEGAISEVQANALMQRYQPMGDSRALTWVVRLSAVILIVGGGVLMLMQHWYDISRLTRIWFALIPLLMTQVLCLYGVRYQGTTTFYRELSAMLLGMMQAVAIVLMGITFQRYDSIWQYALLWLLMALPVALIMRVEVLFICVLFAMVMTVYSLPTVYIDGEGVKSDAVFLVIALWACATVVEWYHFNRLIARWATVLCALFIVMDWYALNKFAQYGNEKLLWVGFAMCYALGLGHQGHGWRNPLRFLGSAGIYVVMLLSASGQLYEIQPQTALPLWLGIMTLVVVLGLLYFARPHSWAIHCLLLVAYPFYLSVVYKICLHPQSIVCFMLAQLYLLLTGVVLIVVGIQKVRLLLINAGLLLIIVLLLFNVMDHTWSQASRGMVFILCGVALLLVNVVRFRHHTSVQISPAMTPSFSQPDKHRRYVFTLKPQYRFGLLVLVFLAEFAYLAQQLYVVQSVVNSGVEYRFQTMPFSPEKSFRNRYMWLNFTVEQRDYPLTGAEMDCQRWRLAPNVYAELRRNAQGMAEITALSLHKPTGDALRVRVRYCQQNKATIAIALPFKHFATQEWLYPARVRQGQDAATETYLVVRVRGDEAIPQRLVLAKKTDKS